MRRQKCTQCGTMLDISKLEAGSKFACASCGAILVVGEATAVKKSLKDSGPAFTPKGKSEAPAPARHRAAEPRPERAARRSHEPAAKKSKLPIFIAIGVVAVGIVVAIVLTSGKGGGPGGAPKGMKAIEWWAQQSPKLSTASADELRAILEDGKAKGFDKDAAFWSEKEGQVQRALLKKDPSDKGANLRAGNKNLGDYPDFATIWSQLQGKETPVEFQEYFDTLGVTAQNTWVPPAKYDEAVGKLEEFVAWRKKLDENPAAEPTERFTRTARTMLSSSQRKIAFTSVAEGPFVLLLAYPDEGDGEKAKGDILAEGKKWTAALQVLREQFDKRIREPLGLPAIEAGKYYCDLVVPTADDLAKFAREGEGLDAVGDVPSFFSLRTKWAVLRAPTEANEKALFGGDLAHEAFHQLQWHYSNDPDRKFENYMSEWNGIWLTEGLAEYLGGGVDLDPASGKATFSGKPPRRIEFLRGMRDNGVPVLPLRELIQLRPDNYAKGIAHWRARLSDREDLPEAATQWLDTQEGVTMKVLYAHAWLLVSFLHDAEDGKYRTKLLDLVLTAFRGGRKPERYRKDPSVAEKFAGADEAFAEILGLKDEASWETLQKSYEKYLRSVRGD
jgi:predicted RNA-binding Zn-ribbon protein involved in translation (DUF1610 family)